MAKHRSSCASITPTLGLMCPSPTNTGSGFCKSANAFEPREPKTLAAVRTICPPNVAPVPNVRIAIKRSKAIGPHANRTAKCYPFSVAFCQVKYRDNEGIVHQVDVQADSLFEAVAAAVHVFRKSDWCGHPPGPGCEFSVKLLPETPAQTYTVTLTQVQDFARYGAVKGPKGIIKKNKLRELLGIPD